VLERHNVPGGCASFFQRDGYRFDVGATLASGFGSRGVHRLLNARLGVVVSPEVTEPAMVVHLPDVSVTRHGGQRWHAERLRVFGPSAEPFWHAQERIAELAWDFSKDAPPLPVDAASIAAFLRALRPGHLPLALTLGRNVASIMPRPVPPPLRAFVDAQLLITAQTDAAHADLAYGCTALDLAREGTYHLADGISTIAESLARAVRRLGGRIRYNAVVGAIETERGRVHAVRLTDGTRIDCDRVIAAIPLQNTAALCPPLALKLRPRLAALPERWGAFTLYCGLPPGIVPPEMPLHHQFVTEYDAPPGEGNTGLPLAFRTCRSPPRPQRRSRRHPLDAHGRRALGTRSPRRPHPPRRLRPGYAPRARRPPHVCALHRPPPRPRRRHTPDPRHRLPPRPIPPHPHPWPLPGRRHHIPRPKHRRRHPGRPKRLPRRRPPPLTRI